MMATTNATFFWLEIEWNVPFRIIQISRAKLDLYQTDLNRNQTGRCTRIGFQMHFYPKAKKKTERTPARALRRSTHSTWSSRWWQSPCSSFAQMSWLVLWRGCLVLPQRGPTWCVSCFSFTIKLRKPCFTVESNDYYQISWCLSAI